jgi:hypothetical protein
MKESDIGEQWGRLCDEHEAARDAYFRAFSAVNQKFVAIGNSTSTANPTEGELSDFQKTWQAWQEVKRRMDEFVKSYAESRGRKFAWPAELGR